MKALKLWICKHCGTRITELEAKNSDLCYKCKEYIIFTLFGRKGLEYTQ